MFEVGRTKGLSEAEGFLEGVKVAMLKPEPTWSRGKWRRELYTCAFTLWVVFSLKCEQMRGMKALCEKIKSGWR